MTTALVSEHCVACRKDAPKVTPEEIAELKPLIPDWNLVEIDGIPRLVRTFKVANFLEAWNSRNVSARWQRWKAITRQF